LFFYAAHLGKISIVIMLTALYPIVTLLLSFIFLQEAISIKQSLGVLLAVLAIIFLAT
jgi:transporter family protein